MMIDEKKAENQSEQSSREPASGVNREAILAGLSAAIFVTAANLGSGLISEVVNVDRTWCASGLFVLGIGGYNFRKASTAKQRVQATVLIAVGVVIVSFLI